MRTTAFALILLAGCTAREPESMTMMYAAPALRAGIPPIDAAAPAKVQTLTFAVG